MAANTNKRLPGLCKTYRAELKKVIEVFVELKNLICAYNAFDTQLQLFHNV